MSDQTGQSAKFVSGSLMRHVAVMSFTAGMGLTAVFAVELVDMIFISMLGNAALAAAIGYAGALIFITTSISIGLSIAAGALVARQLGAGDPGMARRYASSAMVSAILVSLIATIIVQVLLEPALALLGATGEVLSLATGYARIIIFTMPIMAMAMQCSAIIRAFGDARMAMYSTLGGSLVNLVLDPILIFGLDMGLEGAAWASVGARFGMLVVGWYAVQVKHHGLQKPILKEIMEDLGKVLQIALPAILTNIATPVGSAIVTREMAPYGTDAVAGMAIVARLVPVSFAVIFSLSGSVGPIIGQNLGAGRKDRVMGAVTASYLFTLYYALGVSLLLFLLRDVLAAAFRAEGLTRDFVYLYCGPLSLLFFFQGCMFISNAACNNLGRPFYATLLNWSRNTIGTWPPAMLGGYLYGGLGVMAGQALGGVIFAIFAWYLTRQAVHHSMADKDTDKIATLGRFQQLFGRKH